MSKDNKIVACGGLRTGFRFFGPFTQAEAEQACERMSGTGADTTIETLEGGSNVPTYRPAQRDLDEETITIAITAQHVSHGFYEAPADAWDAEVLRWASDGQPLVSGQVPLAWWASLTEETRKQYRTVFHRQYRPSLGDEQSLIYKSRQLTDAESDRYGGMEGASRTCAEVAVKVHKAWRAVQDRWDLDHPGVFEYEVSEPVGKHLRKIGDYDGSFIVSRFVDFFKPAFADAGINEQDFVKVLVEVLR
jgi:hypothetical protein